MPEQNLTNLTPQDLQSISNIMGGLLDKQAAVLRSELASKKDLQDLENRMTTKIDNLETRLVVRIDEAVEAVMGGMDAMVDKFTEKDKFGNSWRGLKGFVK